MPGGFHPPPSVIASWPEPNYVDPQTKGKELLAISVLLTILAIIFVVARLWVRYTVQKQLGWDDYLLALSLIFSIALTALFTYTEFRSRWYRHVWNVPSGDFVFRQLHSWTVQLLFVVSTSCTKASILLLYRRVIKGTVNPVFMFVVTSAVTSIFLYFIVYMVLMIFQCWPPQAFWEQYSFPDKYTKDFKCLYEGDVAFSNACISVVTDFVTALLPIFLFVQVQLPKRQKISLAILFGVGFMVCILGIVRAVVVHHVLYETYDVTWNSYYAWNTTVTENHIGVICAALPPLRSMFSDIYSRITGRNKYGTHSNTPNNSGGGYMLHNNNSSKRHVRGNSNSNSEESPSVVDGKPDTWAQEYKLENNRPSTASPNMAKPLPRVPSGLSDGGSIDTDILVTDLQVGDVSDNSQKVAHE